MLDGLTSLWITLNSKNMWPFTFVCGTYCGVIVPVISTVAVCLFTFSVLKWLNGDINVPVKDSSKQHNWQSIKVTAKSWYCSICENLLLSGFGVYCDCCGVCADPECIKQADKKLRCKVTSSTSNTIEHHWVKGNLPLGAICNICNEDCCMETGLVDFQCCWCQSCVHSCCLDKHSKLCDFGPFRELIVPPWCIQVVKRKNSVRRFLQIKSVKEPGFSNWTPLIVIANQKSGDGDAALLLSEFRRMLHPAQVLDLAEKSAEAALHWCTLVAPHLCKILVAGGDGTVAWIMNTIHKMQLKPAPGVAIIPLGTGNDLSRVIGWGKHYSGDIDVTKLLELVSKAETKPFDRWHVNVTPYRHLGIRMPMKHMFMYNYFSVGVDAQVTLDFHRTRESRLYLFSSRIFNKLLYLCFGTQQVVTADCRQLQERIELYMDGEIIDLPELEAVVVLNISSWGAGVDVWRMNQEGVTPQSYNDGKLEVIGIFSSFHIAQLQVGLSQPYRIGQAKNVEIRLLNTSPVQIDGEPWQQHPASIKIFFSNQASVLVNNDPLQ